MTAGAFTIAKHYSHPQHKLPQCCIYDSIDHTVWRPFGRFNRLIMRATVQTDFRAKTRDVQLEEPHDRGVLPC